MTFFKTITQHYLGKTTLARRSLAEATALADEELRDKTMSLRCNRRLRLELLRAEVEALLGADDTESRSAAPKDNADAAP